MAGLVLESEYWLKEDCMQDTIDNEIAAYEMMREDLEAHHMGEWIVMRDSKVIGTYASFENAANDAVTRFGRGPYLIRQIGAPPITLPASVMYTPSNG
jgi:hypothetical protein